MMRAQPGRYHLVVADGRGILFCLAVAASGLLATLTGLTWDAWLHAADPGLAGQEGVFSLQNPGHLLLFAGMVLTTVGLVGTATLLIGALPHRRSQRRRPIVRLLGVGGCLLLVLTVSGLGAWAVSVDGDGHGPGARGTGTQGQRGLHPAANLPDLAQASAAERQQAQALLDQSLAATQPYRDPEVAKQAGYRLDLTKLTQGARFVHASHPAYRQDGRILDPTHPEALVYRQEENGRLRLVGVLYVMPKDQAGPTVAGPIARWHQHEACLDATSRKVGAAQAGQCPAGTRLRRSAAMMHVWFTASLQTAYARRAPDAALQQDQRVPG